MSKILLVVDNSNIYVQTKHNYGFNARFSYSKFLEKFCRNDDIVAKQITGSKPPANNEFWSKMMQEGWEVFTYERKPSFKRILSFNSGTKEKGVDTSIVANATEVLITLKPDILFLFSGDLDMIPLVEIAKKHSCAVTLWTYRESSSFNLERACDSVFYINDHKQNLIYYQLSPGIIETYSEYKEREVCDEWEAYKEQRKCDGRVAYEKQIALDERKGLEEQETLEKQLWLEQVMAHARKKSLEKQALREERTQQVFKVIEWVIPIGLAIAGTILGSKYIKK